MRRALSLIFAAAGLVACKSPTPLSMDINTGLETDAFTADPPVTRIDVTVTSLDGSVNATVSTEPGGTFDFGNIKDDQQVGIEVTGLDATGATVMRGRSLSGIPLAGIQGEIPVFMQRLGQWARPTGGLAQTHVGGVGASLGERYVIVTGGAKAAQDKADADPTQVDAYESPELRRGGLHAVPAHAGEPGVARPERAAHRRLGRDVGRLRGELDVRRHAPERARIVR
ncbi:MAG: hypothetical protein QM820_02280 [Minicystis sp.]